MKSLCANVERTLSGDADGSSQLGCTPLEHSQCSTGPPWTRTGPTSCANEEGTNLFEPGVPNMIYVPTTHATSPSLLESMAMGRCSAAQAQRISRRPRLVRGGCSEAGPASGPLSLLPYTHVHACMRGTTPVIEDC